MGLGDVTPFSSVAGIQGLKTVGRKRRGRKPFDSFESEEELRKWILEHYIIDERWRALIQVGQAKIFVNDDGVWVCRGETCYRLIAKLWGLSYEVYRFFKALAEGPKMPSQLVRELALPYYKINNYIQYYKKANLIIATEHGYVLNDDHPQFNSLIRLINKPQFFYELDKMRLNEIKWDKLRLICQKPVQHSSNEEQVRHSLDVETIVRRVLVEAEKRLRLDDQERSVLERLVRLIAERMVGGGSKYVYFSSWDELRELLNVDIDSNALREIVKRFENAGILYTAFDRRKQRYGVRIDRSLIQ